MWAALAKAKKEIVLEGINDQPSWKPPRLVNRTFPVGTEITITKGRHEKYALWYDGIWDLHEDYVGEIIRIYSNS